ncbi:MAG: hypothetical protein HY540_03605 [Deltaproteobacteria bacterium]|nr:hypothetical protein [Deltaproteobacteria bacterium]
MSQSRVSEFGSRWFDAQSFQVSLPTLSIPKPQLQPMEKPEYVMSETDGETFEVASSPAPSVIVFVSSDRNAFQMKRAEQKARQLQRDWEVRRSKALAASTRQFASSAPMQPKARPLQPVQKSKLPTFAKLATSHEEEPIKKSNLRGERWIDMQARKEEVQRAVAQMSLPEPSISSTAQREIDRTVSAGFDFLKAFDAGEAAKKTKRPPAPEPKKVEKLPIPSDGVVVMRF